MPVEAGWFASVSASPIAIGRRFEMYTAIAIPAAARTAIRIRRPSFWSSPTESVITDGAINSDTRFITLSSGLIAGPAVSLNGSPTVSPMMVASWAGDPLPPWLPSSTSFLELSQAPPELARKTAISVPVPIAPAR